jgi:hypothetical protein
MKVVIHYLGDYYVNNGLLSGMIIHNEEDYLWR